MTNSPVHQYVILPTRGLRARGADSTQTATYLRALSNHWISTQALETAVGGADLESPPDAIRVIDTISEDGAKLVEMAEDTAADLRKSQPGVLVEPVRYYSLARLEPWSVLAPPPTATPAAAMMAPVSEIEVIDAISRAPVTGALVVAFTNFAYRIGAQGKTDGAGRVALDFGIATPTIERLYVYPPLAGYWGVFRQNTSLREIRTIKLMPVNPDARTTGLDHFIDRPMQDAGKGVVVGVIDTGVGPHQDLPHATGDVDNGDGHGTHVAGIVTAVAPGVTIRSYRVFARAGGLSANFGIAKAIDQAISDGCDIVNLSLKISSPVDGPGVQVDPVVAIALEDARESGCLPIAAAGNDSRAPVSFPARESNCVAISALGRKGTYPSGSLEVAEEQAPFGTDPLDYIAAFSNVGAEIAFCGPGVGIVSTVLGGYGVMSGTSMACPAVVGLVARLLAAMPAVHNMPRDAARSAAMVQLLQRTVKNLGFPRELEGFGLPQ